MNGIHSETIVLEVDIPSAFLPFLSDALVRLGYLHPAASFLVGEDRVTITTSDALIPVIKRDLNFALYRQKVYSENLSIRSALMESIAGR